MVATPVLAADSTPARARSTSARLSWYPRPKMITLRPAPRGCALCSVRDYPIALRSAAYEDNSMSSNQQVGARSPVDAARRRFFQMPASGAAVAITSGVLARLVAAESTPGLPKNVAGVTLPDTPAALAAGDLARAACPAFLYNHCMRTFVFAALLAERDHVSYDGEMIFIAAALHDLGLTKRYATAEQPFEMDGADAAKEFLIKRGVTEARAELVWNAIAMHASTLAAHQTPQVRLVGGGAGVDVFGSGLKSLPAERVQQAIAVFPRLGFKTAFRDLLVDHCQRKPFAQSGA